MPSNLDQLWAPWRETYISAAKTPGDDERCFICTGLAERDDKKHLIALRTPRSVVILNRFPYNNGQLLVESQVGKGSAFTVVLPITRADAPAADAAAPEQEEPVPLAEAV